MKKTKWLKRWFDDGIWPGEMEVFESAVDGTSGELVRRYYHRFNMNRDDWGDFEGTSLNGVELNSDAAVQELMKDPVEFRNSTTFDVTDKDAASPLTSGLRFLNMIGSDKGGFTTLEFRRKQIAANIIDYCDKDSVPTSDVPASEWKNNVISGGAFPEYTGNEKTPYINEFAIGLDINPTLTGANGKDLKVNVTITPEMIGELINIYAKTSSDNYKLLIHLKAMTIKLKIKGFPYTQSVLHILCGIQNVEFSIIQSIGYDCCGEIVSLVFQIGQVFSCALCSLPDLSFFIYT